MNYIKQSFVRNFSRLRRSRTGSVMILVVTLLVLMALIGTAYLTTTRNDRYSVQQHAATVQYDQLLDMVKGLVVGPIGRESFLDPAAPAPTQLFGAQGSGQRWDDVESDPWLASRVPTIMAQACGTWNPNRTYSQGEWVQAGGAFFVSRIDSNVNNAPGVAAAWLRDTLATGQTPCWEALSAPFPAPVMTNRGAMASDDVRGALTFSPPPANSGATPITPSSFDGTRSRYLAQLVFQDPNAAGKQNGAITVNGRAFPALRIYYPGDPAQMGTSGQNDGFIIIPAGSASGDGIADSLLWRLPVSPINGLTFYAAVRVVDNNAAVNLTTAGSSLYDFDGAGNPLPNLGLFPGDVGLAELMYDFNLSGATDTTISNDFASSNLFRATGEALPYDPSQGSLPHPDGIMFNNLSAGINPPISDYYDGYPLVNNPEMRYLSEADAQFMGLGRRVEFPGWSLARGHAGYGTLPPVPPTPPVPFGGAPTAVQAYRFNAYTWDDSAALAYKFDLVDPQSVVLGTPTTAASNAERGILSLSNFAYHAPQVYDPTKAWDPSVGPWNVANPQYSQLWFNLNYLYDGPPDPTTFLPYNIYNRRPLVVARNPQSNLMPLHVREMDLLGRQWGIWFQDAMGYVDPQTNLQWTLSPNFNNRGNLPKVSLNTADVLAPVSTANMPGIYMDNGAFSTQYNPVHWPTLWLGFYNAMVPALEPPYSGPRYDVNHPDPRYYEPDTVYSFNAFSRSYLIRPNHSNDSASGNSQATAIFGLNATNQATIPLAQQFRSSLRDADSLGPFPPSNVTDAGVARTFLPPHSQLLLRSLIAALNAQDMRDSDDDVSSATIFGFPMVIEGTFYDVQSSTNASNNALNNHIRLTVFGAERQPYITEVFVDNDTSQQPTNLSLPGGGTNNITGGKTNPNGYVAVELYNPYDVPISLNNWALGILHRSRTVGTSFKYPNMQMRQVQPSSLPFPATVSIRPHDFLVLENVQPLVDTTQYRPWWVYAGSKIMSAQTPATALATDISDTVHYLYVPGLETVLQDPNDANTTGDELFLLRPRRADGLAMSSAYFNEQSTGPNAYSASKATSYLTDMVPVDSFDFYGMSKSNNVTFQAWHYVRANSLYSDSYPPGTPPQPINPPRPSWKFVYRGHWDPRQNTVTYTNPAGTPTITQNPAGTAHEDGVVTAGLWTADGSNGTPPEDPWINAPPGFSATPSPLADTTDGPGARINIGGPDYNSSYNNPYPGDPINYTGYGDYGQVVYTPSSGSPPPPETPRPFEYGMNKNVVKGPLSVTPFTAYPFGGFARTGDVVGVPFIGAYTITWQPPGQSAPTVIEMNPITADAGFADDNISMQLGGPTNTFVRTTQTSVSNPPGTTPVDIPYTVDNEDKEEHIGRFAPLSAIDPGGFFGAGISQMNFWPPDGPATPAPAPIYGQNVNNTLPNSKLATPWVPGQLVVQSNLPANPPNMPWFDTYGWAARVFDYFSVLQAPNDDYLPQTKPERNTYNLYLPGTSSATPLAEPLPVTNNQGAGSPMGVSSPNGISQASGRIVDDPAEKYATVEGLININTAPWRVLAELPFFTLQPPSLSSSLAIKNTNVQMLLRNEQIAQAIVRYRNTYGPFHSIFELNRVFDPLWLSKGFVFQGAGASGLDATGNMSAGNTEMPAPGNGQASYTALQGVLAPNFPGYLNDAGASDGKHLPNGLLTDCSERFAEMLKVSNLITTRSDSYTVYIEIQGWRNADNANAASLVVDRRTAFIVDRSGATRTMDFAANTTAVTAPKIPAKIKTD